MGGVKFGRWELIGLAATAVLVVGVVAAAGVVWAVGRVMAEKEVNYADGENHRVGNVVLKVDPVMRRDNDWLSVDLTLKNVSNGQILTMLGDRDIADEHGNAIGLFNTWVTGDLRDKKGPGETASGTVSVKPVMDADSYRVTLQLACDKEPDGRVITKEIVFTVPVEKSTQE